MSTLLKLWSSYTLPPFSNTLYLYSYLYSYLNLLSSAEEMTLCHIQLMVKRFMRVFVFKVDTVCVCVCLIYNLFVCLFVWVLWHINFCWLFNAKSIFIQMNSSISNYTIQPKYTVYLSKIFLFQAIQFSQTVLIQTIQFSLCTISMPKTVQF